MAAQHPGDLLHRLEARAHDLDAPLVQERPGPVEGAVVPEIVKPFPAGTDDWSHPYHGPDNNPQSTDQLARAPYLTHFLAEPWYSPMPLMTVADQIRRVGTQAIAAFLPAIPFALLLSWLASAVLSKRVRAIAEVAQRYAVAITPVVAGAAINGEPVRWPTWSALHLDF